MLYRLQSGDIIGLVRPQSDAHTLGMSALSHLLAECGVASHLAGANICEEIADLERSRDLSQLRAWIKDRRITVLGFSYRLDPADGARLFANFYNFLRTNQMLAQNGGPIRGLFFAGLPETCQLVDQDFPGLVGLFQGDESPLECLAILGLDESRMPSAMAAGNAYDDMRMKFGYELIARGNYQEVKPVHRTYPGFGTVTDTLVERIANGRLQLHPPLMRVHVGPYSGNPAEDFRQFRAWTKKLAADGLLDVLSIGTSQLTQSHFYESREGLTDGGGISISDPEQYAQLWHDARPMLVRTYAGTRDMPRLAAMHEKRLHIAWHALSFWWFCQLDGRGPYGLRENLEQHFDTMRYIASTGKPLEPNVPHHFAFRGGDDVSYVVSGFLAAKAAQKAGIRTLVLQVMLNTPKYTWGLQDLAKARALRELVRFLEDRHFQVILQPRGGLDYFSPDLNKAKAQLAAVSALMADIEPDDRNSPPVIHVVSYSEASHLADPAIINESIQITRQALWDYRNLKARGRIEDLNANQDLQRRVSSLISDARAVIDTIEALIPDPYSPAGFETIFAAGFLPVPWLWECRDQYPLACAMSTKLIDGGMRVVDLDGKAVPVRERLAQSWDAWKRGKT